MKSAKILKPYRITKPNKFRLADHDPADTNGLDIEKDEAKAILAEDTKSLSDQQERLYAEHRWAVLVIFQAMDAAGKDSAIKHVMSGVNPQGCSVHSFKAPTPEDLDHDFLWRATGALPRRGHIGIFNRSYYEEVLVVRVRPELLANEKVPPALVDKDIWKHRFADIRAFEHHLRRNGTLILKFFLNISEPEQRRRFLERLEQPQKRWKFSMGDVQDRKLWDRYMAAYEDMIRHTSTAEAPWHVVPADNKWFARLVVSAAIVDAMKGLKLEFPKVEGAALKELEKARRALEAKTPKRRK
jgi:PPK2 family polyphosphate:nucleotide phosphotransferase